MLTIPDILTPRHVLLDLQAPSGDEAVLKVASLLRQDERVRDWVGFYSALKEVTHCVETNQDFEVCIPHTRTDCVTTMVMSVGRSPQGVTFSKAKHPVRYIFCIGLPKEMASEYLRIIGAIARFFKDPEMIQRLDAATTPAELIAILSEKEMAL
jgi:mannitol/fructose-specific phosphotransferase system IIA component (Ntr-type)